MARATASSGVMVSTSITIPPSPSKEGLPPCGLLCEEGFRRITVRRSVILGRKALGEHGRRSTEPDDRDVRRGQRGPALRDIDHARGSADDVPLGRRQRVHQCGGLAAMHRVDALLVTKLPNRPPRRRLDVDVGIAPVPPDLGRQLATHGRLAGTHQPGQHDVPYVVAHADSLAPERGRGPNPLALVPPPRRYTHRP